MKIICTIMCFFILSAICVAEETEYWDWKGGQLYASRDYNGALEYYDKAVKQDPNFVNGWIHKGDTQRVLKDYNGSIISYNYALHLDGNNTVAWSGITEAYTSLKDYANASVAAAKVTELADNKGNWLREGNLLQMQGLFEEAIAKYDGALALDPQYRDALYKKGSSLMVTGKSTDALQLFNQVLEIDPNYKQAYNAQGICQEVNGKYTEALQAYDKALEIDPNYTQALMNKMQVLLILKKPNDAMQIFIKV